MAHELTSLSRQGRQQIRAEQRQHAHSSQENPLRAPPRCEAAIAEMPTGIVLVSVPSTKLGGHRPRLLANMGWRIAMSQSPSNLLPRLLRREEQPVRSLLMPPA